jgi:hypothetical protein
MPRSRSRTSSTASTASAPSSCSAPVTTGCGSGSIRIACSRLASRPLMWLPRCRGRTCKSRRAYSISRRSPSLGRSRSRYERSDGWSIRTSSPTSWSSRTRTRSFASRMWAGSSSPPSITPRTPIAISTLRLRSSSTSCRGRMRSRPPTRSSRPWKISRRPSRTASNTRSSTIRPSSSSSRSTRWSRPSPRRSSWSFSWSSCSSRLGVPPSFRS